jgi:muramidase (phage lysozyme)
MPSPATGSRQGSPFDGFNPDQAPPGAFDPSYFSGGGPFDGSHGQVTPLGSEQQQPLAGGDGAPAMDRNAAIQHAAAAIQRGADPEAVHTRLNQMGHTDLEPPSPFSDLVPDGPQATGMMRGQGIMLSGHPRPAPQDQGGFEESLFPVANSQRYRGNLQSLSDPMMAPQKVDRPNKSFQSKSGDQVGDRASATGRAVADIVNRPAQPSNPPAPNLTPWQRRRRAENEAIAAQPRMRAFLDAIALAEGNTNYDSLYGNHHQTFTGRSTHPGNVGQNGGGAAGRYQILPRTYRDLNHRLGPYSMSDRDQDLMAIELIRERNAMPLILSGRQADFDEAVSRLGSHRIWASFPVLDRGVWQPNPSGQRTEDIRNIRTRFNESLARSGQRGQGRFGRQTGPIRD